MLSTNPIQLNLSEKEFRMLIKDIIREYFIENQKESDQSLTDLITMKEVAAIYHVSLVTIHKWRKHKILPPTIKKGGRVFFRRDEILKSLEQ